MDVRDPRLVRSQDLTFSIIFCQEDFAFTQSSAPLPPHHHHKQPNNTHPTCFQQFMPFLWFYLSIYFLNWYTACILTLILILILTITAVYIIYISHQSSVISHQSSVISHQSSSVVSQYNDDTSFPRKLLLILENNNRIRKQQ